MVLLKQTTHTEANTMNTYILTVNAGLYFERAFSFKLLGDAMSASAAHRALGHTATISVENDCFV